MNHSDGGAEACTPEAMDEAPGQLALTSSSSEFGMSEGRDISMENSGCLTNFDASEAHICQLVTVGVPGSTTMDNAEVRYDNIIQIDTANKDSAAGPSRHEADGNVGSIGEASEPSEDSGADDGDNEDGEFDNYFPDEEYYCPEDPEEISGFPVSQSITTEQQAVSNEAGPTNDGDIRGDWNALHVQDMLNSRTTTMTLSDIKEALVKAVETNNPLTICQLLPLLPESHVRVGGVSAMGHMQESLGNMFLPNLLSSAIKLGKLEAAKALIRGPESAAGCKQLGETDLILAVQPGSDVGFVKQFLDTSCVNAQDLHGRTALSYAVQHGLAKIVRFLVKEVGASAKIEDSQGWPPLQYAFAVLENEQIEEQQRMACGEIIDYLMTYET